MAPDPLTPADCDLRGFDFMPLFGQRLFGSRFYSLALQNPRAGLAGQKLWWEAWQQCPAGSLPADDFTLCRLADFGADLKAWAKAKEIALHGFVLCSDGRLYHPVLCAEAILAYERRIKDRTRKAKWRASKDADGHGGPEDVPRDRTVTERGSDAGRDGSVRADRTGQRQDSKEREEEPPVRPPLPVDNAPPQAAAPTRRRGVERGCRLPEEWQPGAAECEFAISLGLNPSELAAEFRDYWRSVPGARGCKLDWPATFRNRCRERASRVAVNRSGHAEHSKFRNGFAEIASRIERGDVFVLTPDDEEPRLALPH